MSFRNHWAIGGVAALLLLAPAAYAAENAREHQSMEELRNTVINLLQALVSKGLLTREQAEQLVKQAQDKAAADAAAAVARNGRLFMTLSLAGRCTRPDGRPPNLRPSFARAPFKLRRSDRARQVNNR